MERAKLRRWWHRLLSRWHVWRRPRRVVEWVSWEAAQERGEPAVGGLGGWFGFREGGQRWADYLEDWHPRAHPYLEAIREAVLRDGIRQGGHWHQEAGCPVFDDGTAASFSMRAWGDLLAAIWSEAEDVDYSYVDFAWNWNYEYKEARGG